MLSDIAGKRVLILSIGTRGDVQPFLVLAAALRRAGAEPLLATLPHYTHLGREFGVRVVSILADGVRWPEPADLGEPPPDPSPSASSCDAVTGKLCCGSGSLGSSTSFETTFGVIGV